MTIKPHAKPKKKVKLSTLRNKCDRELQELGRIVYKKCLVCGNPMQVLHHFVTKGCSSALRYDWQNCIPLCHGCHSRHHQANDPRIHGTIMKIKGEEWYDELEWKRCNLKVLPSQKYYNNIMKNLQLAKEENKNNKLKELLKPYKVK